MNRLVAASGLTLALAVTPACDFDDYQKAQERTEAAADEYGIREQCLDGLRIVVREQMDGNTLESPTTLSGSCLEVVSRHPDMVSKIEAELEAEKGIPAESRFFLGGATLAATLFVLSRFNIVPATDAINRPRVGRFRP